ncbi:type IV pilus inner membrane component PilO [Lentisalinibacter salinarum]|uniref:type 4a pilus biogenesis protein PilO n=1 Tax=Lentisalinibacter salinarum TaxID=2992239 RepID=UPI00386AB37B
MNVIEELRNLDTNDVGRWPLAFRVGAIVIVFVAVTVFGIYMTVVKNKVPLLERAEAREQELRQTFETKQSKAANFDAYRAQLAQMQQSFGTMLRQLPGETEIPNLIVDISQTGLAAGLEEKLFEPQGELRKDFYAEKPIKIQLAGSYHELANFASSVAALPRIVTLHDIQIQPATDEQFDQLSLDVTAKTYRYLEEETE